MRTATRSIDRTTLVAAAAVAVLAVGAVLVVAFAGEPDPLDPSSPEGVVQAYVSATLDGDRPAALGLTAQGADLGLTCEPYPMIDRDVRVELVDVRVDGDRAVVDVRIVFDTADDPFGSGWSVEDRFRLAKVDGRWLIESAPLHLNPCH